MRIVAFSPASIDKSGEVCAMSALRAPGVSGITRASHTEREAAVGDVRKSVRLCSPELPGTRRCDAGELSKFIVAEGARSELTGGLWRVLVSPAVPRARGLLIPGPRKGPRHDDVI